MSVNVKPMKNSNYDLLKKIVELGLPGLGAFYFSLSQIWGLPAGEEVVGTVAVLTTFLGVVLLISNNAYKAENSEV